MNSSFSSDLEWHLPAPVDSNCLAEINLSFPIRALLARRGLASPEEVQELINPKDPPNPFEHYPYLEKAVARLEIACERGEQLAICGDYDADGMTSTALLMSTLNILGAKPIAEIPDRKKDGYGLSVDIVNKIYSQKINLIITVDNGISAIEALKETNKLGMDVILTDHHTVSVKTPEVLALIHPSTIPNDSPYKCLAGVGIAYILASKLAERRKSPQALSNALDLFCIGTIADMAPLNGANRSILKKGIKRLHKTNCQGIKALQKLSGIDNRVIKAEDIGFKLAPKINAVGRIGEPKLIIRLLISMDFDQALQMARECEILNRQRQELCDAIEAESLALIDSGDESQSFFLLAQSHWHQGVIGIVASRIMQKFNRPVAMLAGDKDGFFRASVRGPEGFSVINALDQCADILEKYGGHPAAAGFSIKADNVIELHRRLNKLAQKHYQLHNNKVNIKPDANLRFSDINRLFIKELNQLEPFGIGNKKPLFSSRKCLIKNQRLLKGIHLKLDLLNHNIRQEAIIWGWNNKLLTSKLVDIVYHLDTNHWNGEEKIQLTIKAIRDYQDYAIIFQQGRKYKCKIINESTIDITNQKGQSIQAKIDDDRMINISDKHLNNQYVSKLIQISGIALGILP